MKANKIETAKVSEDSSVSSTFLQDFPKAADLRKDVKKLQCDLCKLSYPSEKELTEHLVSLMHHTKLGDSAVPHCCTLCGFTCQTMAEYRTHTTSEKHQKKISALRNESVPVKEFKGPKRFMKNIRAKSNSFPKKFSTPDSFDQNHSSPYFQGPNPNWNNRFYNSMSNEDQNYSYINSPRSCFSYQNNNRGKYHYRISQYDESQPLEPWGSGIFGQHNQVDNQQKPSAFYVRGRSGGRFVSRVNKGKTYFGASGYNSHTDCEWDDQSLVSQERFLAEMLSDEPFSSYSAHLYHTTYNRETLEHERQFKISEFNGRERKRPRNDDDTEEFLSKSLKPTYGSFNDKSHNEESNKQKSLSSKKSLVNDSSNVILKKAELLCKELRDRNIKAANLSHTDTGDDVKCKSNNGTLNNITPLNVQQQSLQENISSLKPNSIKTKASDQNQQALGCAKSNVFSLKTSALPKSLGKSSDSTTSIESPTSKSSKSYPKKLGISVAEEDSCKSKSVTSAASLSNHLKMKQNTFSEGKEYDKETVDQSSEAGKTLQKSTVKSIAKDNLQKLVNAPRSRDERLRLAKLRHSRDEHKSGPSSSLRSNLQLEGLYDTDKDICLDLGDTDTALTIKVEDLSDGVKEQIIQLIGDDIWAALSCRSKSPSNNTSTSADNKVLKSQGKKVISEPTPPTNSCSRTVKDVSLLKKKKQKKSLKKLANNIPSSECTYAKANRRKMDCNEVAVADSSCGFEDSDVEILNVIGISEKHMINNNPDLPSPIQRGNTSPVCKSITESSHAGLNRDNVNDRYPLIMKSHNAAVSASVDVRSHVSPSVSAQTHREQTLLPHSSLAQSTSSSQREIHAISQTPSQTLPPGNIQEPQLVSAIQPLMLSPSSWLSDRATPSNGSINKYQSSASVTSQSSTAVKIDPPPIIVSDDTDFERNVNEPADKFPEELLSLSEREEGIKQEMVSLDLRLNRLHRLLEQAVAQINKCTERRSQLLEETQVISNQRLTLLRETAAVRLRGKTRELSTSRTDPATLATEYCTRSLDKTLNCTSGDAQRTSFTTLSKEDWLAKFSSFLPPETVSKNSSLTSVQTLFSADKSLQSSAQDDCFLSFSNQDVQCQKSPKTLSLHQLQGSQSTVSVSKKMTEEKCVSRNSESIDLTTREVTWSVDGPQTRLQAKNLAARKDTDELLTSQSIGFKKSLDTILFDSVNPAQTTISVELRKSVDEESSSSPVSRKSTDSAIFDKSIANAGQFLNVQLRANLDKSSMQKTPEKTALNLNSSDIESLHHPEHLNEMNVSRPTFQSLSSIFDRPLVYLGSFKSVTTLPLTAPLIMLNDPSTNRSSESQDPTLDVNSDIDSNNSSASGSSLGERIIRYCQNTPEASLDSNRSQQPRIKPCFVPLQKIDHLIHSGSNYNVSTDEKAAEALHLTERNAESEAGSAKKKKMKTRHERGQSSLRRRHRQRFLSSSSSSSVETVVIDNPQKSKYKFVSDDEESFREDNQTLLLAKALQELKAEVSPAKVNNVIIAECDSSTSLTTGNTDSIAQRLKIIQEMRETFDKTFGSVGSSTKDFTLHLPGNKKSKNSDAETLTRNESSNVKNVSRKIEFSSPSRSKFLEPKLTEDTSEQEVREKMCRFPSANGPVVELQEFQSNLYVAFCNVGVTIYSLQDNSSKTIDGVGVQCMTVAEFQGLTTIVSGVDWQLAFCNPESHIDLQHLSYDMGTAVKCLLVMGPLIYCGLDTGELTIFNIIKMEVKDRFICSDHPLHCLAQSQEGGLKLICASAQDGTILVINALTGLPLRILTGHTKTAFSLCVHSQMVFSGSGDSTVVAHNIHTGAVCHMIRDNKGLVKSVFYYEGFLFTGGMDRLVRCYNVKNFELTQVYYGAERSVICRIFVHNNLLITGNTTGSVDCIPLDLQAENRCHKNGCKLNFGNRSHLFWHILEDHNFSVKK